MKDTKNNKDDWWPFNWRKYTGMKRDIGCTLSRITITLGVVACAIMGIQIYYGGIFSSHGFYNPTQYILAAIMFAIIAFMVGVIWGRGKYAARIIEIIKEEGDTVPSSLSHLESDNKKLDVNRRMNSRYACHIAAFIAGLLVLGSIVMQLTDDLLPGSISMHLALFMPLLIALLIGAILWQRLRNKEMKTIKQEQEEK